MWQFIRWLLWLPDPKWRKSFWDDMTDLEPGKVSIVTDHRNGNQYALMHLDDFDHIAGLSDLVRKDPPETVSEKP